MGEKGNEEDANCWDQVEANGVGEQRLTNLVISLDKIRHRLYTRMNEGSTRWSPKKKSTQTRQTEQEEEEKEKKKEREQTIQKEKKMSTTNNHLTDTIKD